ncbi:MAG: hypothetical protein IJM63_00930 [Solobacterium sp.]|nr:hypothetical protein [Solobacterium sp.]
MNFDTLTDYLGIAIAVFVACAFLYAFYYQWKVKRDGLEATAVITWIEEKESSDEDGVSYYYDYHVAYTTQEGKDVEGILSHGKSHLKEGDIIRIKYLPGKESVPVYIDMK